jgi:nitrate reductase molybdenum cofactor assembly chaperone NarJ/NarW
MTANNDIKLKLCSLLFQYPDRDLLARLPQISAAVDALPGGEFKKALAGILRDMAGRPPLALQEIYTAAFDLTPATTLNLTYHGFGDNEKRAAALVHLQHLYAAAGYARIDGELPDYLPLMLEFLSVCPVARTAAQVWAYMGDLEALSERLQHSAPSYAALLMQLISLRPAEAAAVPTQNNVSETE